MKAKSKAVKKHAIVLGGGPYNGHTLYLTSNNTLPVQVVTPAPEGVNNGPILWEGRYVNGKWEGRGELVWP